MVLIFVTRPRDTKPRGAHRGNNCLLFSTQLYPLSVANFFELLQYNTNRYGVYAKRCSKQQVACWYRLLTADRNMYWNCSVHLLCSYVKAIA